MGVRLLVVVIPQTFGGRLNFHPHLHILVSAAGLHEPSNQWIRWIRFNKRELMEVWRFAVVGYFGRLASLVASNPSQFKAALKALYRKHWNVFVSRRMNKMQFVKYAGRYLRRPPIAESRLTV